jgi:hypothetical protein
MMALPKITMGMLMAKPKNEESHVAFGGCSHGNHVV